MKRILLILLLLPAPLFSVNVAITSQTAQVFFSPNSGSTMAITNQIAMATNNIKVQAFSFTSSNIVQALIKAHSNNVNVQIILDKSQLTAKKSGIPAVLSNNIPTFIDSKHAIAHNKIIIIDSHIIITGSFNFTQSAESKNAENLIILNDKNLAKIYLNNWISHKIHSKEL